MTKPITAKQRIVSIFDGSTWGEEQKNRAEPIVAEGPGVERVALRGPPAMHLRLASTYATLCGLPIDHASLREEIAGLGTCQACRAEASRLRAAVVGRVIQR